MFDYNDLKKVTKNKVIRYLFNYAPVYRRTGGRITYISNDWHEVHVKLPLNWTTRNYVGTLFGGSIYGAIDPIYMIMLIQILGKDYIVWDKSALIKFKKPGKETLYAYLKIDRDEIDFIKSELKTNFKLDRKYIVSLVDKNNLEHAYVEKIIHISKRKL